MELYYLYEKSSKRLRELKTLAEAVNKTVPKPCATGMRWIDHKYQAMKNVFKNLGVYITHIEYLTQTDSQAKMRVNCKAFYVGANKKNIHMAISLDVLVPVCTILLKL